MCSCQSFVCIASAVPVSFMSSCNKQSADVPGVTSQIKLHILDCFN